MPKKEDPIEERFSYKFTENGGKFLYCEDKSECDDFFTKILEENKWEDVEILCYDDSLLEKFSLLSFAIKLFSRVVKSRVAKTFSFGWIT